MKPLRRLAARLKRWRKTKNLAGWLARWNRACETSWKILTSGPPSAQRFHRFERTHSRLLRLSEAKLKT